jgi:hypothetical protein
MKIRVWLLHPQRLDMIWYGDSIAEQFRGTEGGIPLKPLSPMRAVWDRHYGKYRAEVFAMALDKVVHLIWRILNGEAPQARSLTDVDRVSDDARESLAGAAPDRQTQTIGQPATEASFSARPLVDCHLLDTQRSRNGLRKDSFRV